MSYRYSRRAMLVGFGGAVLAGMLAACSNNQPVVVTTVPTTVATTIPTVVPTVAPTTIPTTAPTATLIPTEVATIVPTETAIAKPTEALAPLFTSSKLPIHLLRPAGWQVADFGERNGPDEAYVGLPEQSAMLRAPDGQVTCIVRYYNYKEPGSGDVTGAYVAIQFNEHIERTTISEHNNPDGSMDAEWSYTHPVSKKPYHALVRFIHNEGSAYTYAVMFSAPADSYDQVIETGRQMLASFQENT